MLNRFVEDGRYIGLDYMDGTRGKIEQTYQALIEGEHSNEKVDTGRTGANLGDDGGAVPFENIRSGVGIPVPDIGNGGRETAANEVDAGALSGQLLSGIDGYSRFSNDVARGEPPIAIEGSDARFADALNEYRNRERQKGALFDAVSPVGMQFESAGNTLATIMEMRARAGDFNN